MLGSLPVKLWSGNTGSHPLSSTADIPWRTLLFRPQAGHPGSPNPPDHLWLDFFWMPVVEPYAISEPFSTAGKINMNYAIEPFSYIRRATGMVSLLRSEKITAIPTSRAFTYKYRYNVPVLSDEFRKPIDAQATLGQLDGVFSAGGIFRSPTQICDYHLVPQGQTVAGMSSFWAANALTGDNSRERPYANLLGRVTTKSNTFTVYYTVQALKNPVNLPQDTWNESKGVVLSEYRGNTTLERYINPNDTRIPDYATNNATIGTDPLDRYYNWRVIQHTQFAP
jgi:uncharacterized protein (TIGR02600 family)